MKQTRRQFVRTMFVATQAAAFGPGLAHELFAAESKAGALNYLLLGDWGRKGEPDQAAVAKQMGLCGAKMDAKFVIAVGDNFYEDGVASVTDRALAELVRKGLHRARARRALVGRARQPRLPRQLRSANRILPFF